MCRIPPTIANASKRCKMCDPHHSIRQIPIEFRGAEPLPVHSHGITPQSEKQEQRDTRGSGEPAIEFHNAKGREFLDIGPFDPVHELPGVRDAVVAEVDFKEVEGHG